MSNSVRFDMSREIHVYIHDADFEEGKHPRSENGQFGAGGGSNHSPGKKKSKDPDALYRKEWKNPDTENPSPSDLKDGMILSLYNRLADKTSSGFKSREQGVQALSEVLKKTGSMLYKREDGGVGLQSDPTKK